MNLSFSLLAKKVDSYKKKLMSSSTLVLIDVGEISNPKEVIERGAMMMMMSNRRTYIRAIHLIQIEISTTTKIRQISLQ